MLAPSSEFCVDSLRSKAARIESLRSRVRLLSIAASSSAAWSSALGHRCGDDERTPMAAQNGQDGPCSLRGFGFFLLLAALCERAVAGDRPPPPLIGVCLVLSTGLSLRVADLLLELAGGFLLPLEDAPPQVLPPGAACPSSVGTSGMTSLLRTDAGDCFEGEVTLLLGGVTGAGESSFERSRVDLFEGLLDGGGLGSGCLRICAAMRLRGSNSLISFSAAEALLVWSSLDSPLRLDSLLTALMSCGKDTRGVEWFASFGARDVAGGVVGAWRRNSSASLSPSL
mmetsp:Transcript_39185/g.92236  ORF Transcript_39185/g.92236 Transcript_39185/m.92236 type:complete len:284 (-) Transcript_39185:121-972(-)